MKIAVFMGGVSSEREVSLNSGKAILESLLKQGYDAYGVDVNENNLISAFTDNDYDFAYLAFHGGFGEDGRVQGLLDMLGKAYTGSGATASGVAMDKMLTKKLVAAAGIKTPKSFENVKDIDSYPVVIKPALEGSSVGIYFCNNEDEAKKAVLEARKENKPFFIWMNFWGPHTPCVIPEPYYSMYKPEDVNLDESFYNPMQ